MKVCSAKHIHVYTLKEHGFDDFLSESNHQLLTSHTKPKPFLLVQMCGGTRVCHHDELLQVLAYVSRDIYGGYFVGVVLALDF